jgi:hypothetical protein
VHASGTIHVNGRAVVLGTQGGFTDNEGYLLISELPAGRYYLSAEFLRHSREASKPGRPGIEEDFVHTDDPVPRDITAGAALRNVVIRIRQSAVYRIRGRVTNPPKESPRILLASPDGVLRGDRDPRANLRDGAFEFESIAPGNYLADVRQRGLILPHADHGGRS